MKDTSYIIVLVIDMKYTYNQIIESMPKDKYEEETILCNYIFRPIANRIAYTLLYFETSANVVSIATCILVFGAYIFMAIPIIPDYFGFIIINLFPIMDCVDGSISRTTKKTSYYGEFFDAISGYIMCAFSLFFICIVSINNDRLFPQSDMLMMVICSLGSVSAVFSRLIHQRFIVSSMKSNSTEPYTLLEEKNGYFLIGKIKHIALRFDKYIGIGDGFPMIATVSYYTGAIAYTLIFYSIYNILVAILTFIIYCKKAINISRGL